jgi:hypothetical protein
MVSAFLNGSLPNPALMMPGCQGRCRRHRGGRGPSSMGPSQAGKPTTQDAFCSRGPGPRRGHGRGRGAGRGRGGPGSV